MPLLSRLAARRARPVQAIPGVPPVVAPLQSIAADLRRLSRLIQATEAANQPALIARMQAVTLAYDDVLLEACRALDIATPTNRAPLSSFDRPSTEAELARAGLQW